ncbi:MAG: tryptophan synthase subunit alpha [Calditerrivibrio sp.]|nr:tryptophan synthase subunit alpha [Calditerrivibrio sp.]
MKGAYILYNYPTEELFKKEFQYLLDSKVDFIEVGLPFNDPVADGPVIARASDEVAERGYSLDEIVLEKVSKKIYFMTYSNVIFSYGFNRFSERFGNVLEGVIVADLPNRGHTFFKEHGFTIPIVPFATPESRDEDLVLLDQLSGDFVYFIGIRGITGGNVNFKSDDIRKKYQEIKGYTKKKVIVGFGIKSRGDVDEVLAFADGFVIGTEIVKRQVSFDEFKGYVDSIYV